MSRPSRKPLDKDLYADVVAEAKARFDVWPSAYASGWVVKTYKARGGRYAGATKGQRTGLTKWFGESWVDLSRPIHDEDGELTGYEPCGRKKSGDPGDPADYPKCRPVKEAMRMTPAEVRDAIKRKRAAEAKAGRGGAKGRGGRGARAPVRVPTYRANPELGPLAQQLTDQMDGLFADFSMAHAHEAASWMRSNMMIFGRAPARAKNIQGQIENLAKLLSEVPRFGATQNLPFYKQVWKNIEPFLDEVEALALKEAVTKEMQVDGHTFINEAGLSAANFDKYTKAMLSLFEQLQGWRRGALTDGVTVVFAGPKAFRGTAGGSYRSAQDKLFVRATPAVLKRGAGTYGAFDYIIIHELGHRFERKHRLPEDFDKSAWSTTAYSIKEGEAFAELFALGHFGIEGVHGDTFGDRLARFEEVMGARANPAHGVVLYHRTTPANAAKIVRERRWMSREQPPYVFFSTDPYGHTSYGEALLEVVVPEDVARLDDEFPSGEQHYAVLTRDLAGLPVRLVEDAARANPQGFAAIKAMRNAPEGSLLVSEDGGVAWRKVGPGRHGNGDWARLKPSTTSPDGWQRTVDAYGQPMPPDDFEQIKRFVMREGVLVVPPA